MAGLDPEEDVAPGDTSSQDASKPGFQKAWSAWTSKPENNAALLQFGISMLQPRSPGQSAVGAFANSIGSAGEASGRVTAQQRLDENQTALEEDKAAQRENQATVAGSGRINANAYKTAVDNQVAGGGKGTSSTLRMQQGFRSWLVKPEDTTGMNADPVLGAVQKQFPNIKTKADLLADPAAKAAALRIYSTVSPVEEGDDTSGTPAPLPNPQPASTVAPSMPAPRKYNNRIIHVDPASKKWVYEDNSPVS